MQSSATVPNISWYNFQDAPWNIGFHWGGDWSFDGKIDDFRYYNVSLKQEAIQAIYNGGKVAHTGYKHKYQNIQATLSNISKLFARVTNTFISKYVIE